MIRFTDQVAVRLRSILRSIFLAVGDNPYKILAMTLVILSK